MKFLVRPIYSIIPFCPFKIIDLCFMECAKEKGGSGGCGSKKKKNKCQGYCDVCNKYCGKK